MATNYNYISEKNFNNKSQEIIKLFNTIEDKKCRIL